MPTLPRQIGDRAEALAARFLQQQGLLLIERNYVRRVGEIDLILKDPESGAIVFVEVRYRHRVSCFGDGIDSVGPAKQRKLRRTAAAWLQRSGEDMTPARIDVLAIQPEKAMQETGSDRCGTAAGSPAPEAAPSTTAASAAASNPSVCFEAHRLTWLINAV